MTFRDFMTSFGIVWITLIVGVLVIEVLLSIIENWGSKSGKAKKIQRQDKGKRKTGV